MTIAPGEGTVDRMERERARRAPDLPPGQEPHDPNRGRWIPWAIVAAFAVVFAVNGFMVFQAIDTFPGLETEDAYSKGIAFNQALANAAEQEAQGWQAQSRLEQVGVTGARVDLILKARDGVPIVDAAVSASFVRPTVGGHDLTRPMKHEGDGRYSVELRLPFPGQWQVEITATAPRGRWSTVDRLILR